MNARLEKKLSEIESRAGCPRCRYLSAMTAGARAARIDELNAKMVSGMTPAEFEAWVSELRPLALGTDEKKAEGDGA